MNPKSLYMSAVGSLASNVDTCLDMLDNSKTLTPCMRLDLYWVIFCGAFKSVDKAWVNPKCVQDTRLVNYLTERLGDLTLFSSLLSVAEKRMQLYKMTHAVIHNEDHAGHEPMLFVRLTTQTEELTLKSILTENVNMQTKQKQVTDALNLAQFFTDAGWYVSAIKVIIVAQLSCHRLLAEEWSSTPRNCRQFLEMIKSECQLRLLHAYSAYCNFPEADKIYDEIVTSFQQMRSAKKPKIEYSKTLMMPTQLLELAFFCLMKSEYHSAYDWSMQAVRSLSKETSTKVVIDVLRVASKACVVRGQFSKAKVFIHEAVLRAKEIFGEYHPKFADCLMDFGFYLQNSDGAMASINAYRKALQIRTSIFGTSNLLTALCDEDVAYATYVHEYSTGQYFSRALSHADTALSCMRYLLPENHLLMASAQRVRALILEEIAIDKPDKEDRVQKLREAEQLHMCALRLARNTFGEMNIQTAKHYGNLGRLYQSLENCTLAEGMHIKAIKIKERLLGKEDYEVALSMGHLASLYNYDMREFLKAEKLHKRSIDMLLKLYGPDYSGLEYDYRGLIRIYEELDDLDQCYEYRMKLDTWQGLRSAREDEDWRNQNNLCDIMKNHSRPINQIVAEVSSTCLDDRILNDNEPRNDNQTPQFSKI